MEELYNVWALRAQPGVQLCTDVCLGSTEAGDPTGKLRTTRFLRRSAHCSPMHPFHGHVRLQGELLGFDAIGESQLARILGDEPSNESSRKSESAKEPREAGPAWDRQPSYSGERTCRLAITSELVDSQPYFAEFKKA